MTTNNPNIMKTLKTINKVIGEPQNKNNRNNSTKESKKYNYTTETYYHETSKSYSTSKKHKNLAKEENMFKAFLKKVFFRKWIYRLRLKLAQSEYIQDNYYSKSNNFKRVYDLQKICYSDKFRIPPKHYVDRMRRILPNFDFTHIEEVRKDKYDIKLLWPVNNVLFPPDEKENRPHKIPTVGRNEYLEQLESMKRLSKPKPKENNSEAYNKYIRRRKISQREALELCQRLNFKPSQHKNYDYINDYYNEENYEERYNKKNTNYHKKNKNSSYKHNSKCRVEIETDPNLSDLTAQLAHKRSSNHNSSNTKNSYNSNDNSQKENNSNIVKSNRTSQEKHEKSGNDIKIQQNIKTTKTNYSISKSFGSSNEENTEIVSDSYLLDASATKIKKKKDSQIIVIEEEEEQLSDINQKFTNNYNGKAINNSLSSYTHRISDNEEEEYYKILKNSSKDNQTKTNSYNIIDTELNDEEEEIFKNRITVNNSNQNKNNSNGSSQSNKTGLSEEEEERILNEHFVNKNSTKNKTQTTISTKQSIDLLIEEEEEDVSDKEITKNTSNKQITTNNSLENTKTEIFEEEDEISSNFITNIQLSSQKSSNSHHSVKYTAAEEEEEEDFSFIKKNQNSYQKVVSNIFEEEEEEEEATLNNTKNSRNSSNSYKNISINEEEESHSDYIPNNLNNNIRTEIHEEEEEYVFSSNNKNHATKTTSKVVKTTTTKVTKTFNNQETPQISHIVKQFTHSTSKNYDDVDDNLFSDSSVDHGILVGSTSSGIGPIKTKNNSDI